MILLIAPARYDDFVDDLHAMHRLRIACSRSGWTGTYGPAVGMRLIVSMR